MARGLGRRSVCGYGAGVPEGYQLVDCSFCGRPNRQVHIVAGRDGLHICSVSVEKCADVLDRDTGVPSPPGGWVGRWPQKDL
jgi:hypothetical protein